MTSHATMHNENAFYEENNLNQVQEDMTQFGNSKQRIKELLWSAPPPPNWVKPKSGGSIGISNPWMSGFCGWPFPGQ